MNEEYDAGAQFSDFFFFFFQIFIGLYPTLSFFIYLVWVQVGKPKVYRAVLGGES